MSNRVLPFAALADALGRLQPAALGVIAARAGTGKSNLLAQIAVHEVLSGRRVLHVCVRDTVSHTRAHYDDVVRVHVEAEGGDVGQLRLTVERGRLIHSYLDRRFDVALVARHVAMVADVAQFSPDLLVVDGLTEETLKEHLASLVDLARSLTLPLWVTVVSSGDDAALAGLPGVSQCFSLVAQQGAIVVVHIRPEGLRRVLPLRLDPVTMMPERSDARKQPDARGVDAVLYSGGARGAESAFGEEAQRFGLREVNFSFEGHKQERTHGRKELTLVEMAAGDVSLVHVSSRLNRTYSTEGAVLQKVLQTLWHVVSRANQVFVVGQICPDDTVVGGTGWSVELARSWNKDVWVYDQERLDWYHWDNGAWMPGTPRITATHFAGTGTRYLNDAGRAAVSDLFVRSFTRL